MHEQALRVLNEALKALTKTLKGFLKALKAFIESFEGLNDTSTLTGLTKPRNGPNRGK